MPAPPRFPPLLRPRKTPSKNNPMEIIPTVILCGSILLTSCSKGTKQGDPLEKPQVTAETRPLPPPLKIGEAAILLRGQTMNMAPDGSIQLLVNQNPAQHPDYPNGTGLKIKCPGQHPPSTAFAATFKNHLQFRNVWIVIPLLPGSPKTLEADLWKKEANPEKDIPENRR